MKWNGYASETVNVITNWALEQKNISRIKAEVSDDNIASIRVLEKCGFIKINERGIEGTNYYKNKVK